jgi:hypothetical protein
MVRKSLDKCFYRVYADAGVYYQRLLPVDIRSQINLPVPENDLQQVE